ncbi:hypothetical protein F4778DRAFT_262240 [Xylariomycetidae sp. FL2044]|nr:hypothetical protein F4778DRAFT_262240 [Xylariomycetidae sp. FL2044]
MPTRTHPNFVDSKARPANTKVWTAVRTFLEDAQEQGAKLEWKDGAIIPIKKYEPALFEAVRIIGDADDGFGTFPKHLKDKLGDYGFSWILAHPSNRIIPNCWAKYADTNQYPYDRVRSTPSTSVKPAGHTTPASAPVKFQVSLGPQLPGLTNKATSRVLDNAVHTYGDSSALLYSIPSADGWPERAKEPRRGGCHSIPLIMYCRINFPPDHVFKHWSSSLPIDPPFRQTLNLVRLPVPRPPSHNLTRDPIHLLLTRYPFNSVSAFSPFPAASTVPDFNNMPIRTYADAPLRYTSTSTATQTEPEVRQTPGVEASEGRSCCRRQCHECSARDREIEELRQELAVLKAAVAKLSETPAEPEKMSNWDKCREVVKMAGEVAEVTGPVVGWVAFFVALWLVREYLVFFGITRN